MEGEERVWRGERGCGRGKGCEMGKGVAMDGVRLGWRTDNIPLI